MKLFISWSGPRSKLLAEALRAWLPGVINAVEPWLSSSDIDPGSRWGPELATQLENTKYGILCLTSDNTNSPWILFEAGALSKYVAGTYVVPLLLDQKPTDIQGPLTQFQSVTVQEGAIKNLVVKINQAVFEAGEKGVDPNVIEKSFDLWWPQLKLSIESIPAHTDLEQQPQRPQGEIVEEILTLVRKMGRDLNSLRSSGRYSSANIEILEAIETIRSLPHLSREQRFDALQSYLISLERIGDLSAFINSSRNSAVHPSDLPSTSPSASPLPERTDFDDTDDVPFINLR